ncbi:MAG: hypothetical protein H6978_13080 [Gammaproteobacteria bacterium]|nr:hypothetical protein [Gammaproteobacteria bacterium]
MSSKRLAMISALMFVTWGLLHLAGGALILTRLSEGADAAYSIYAGGEGLYPPLAGSVLGYLAYSFAWTGLLVAAIGGALGRRHSPPALALCTFVGAVTEVGLVLFLVLPGFVSWGEALAGMIIFAIAIVTGGIACNHSTSASGVQTQTALPG